MKWRRQSDELKNDKLPWNWCTVFCWTGRKKPGGNKITGQMRHFCAGSRCWYRTRILYKGAYISVRMTWNIITFKWDNVSRLCFNFVKKLSHTLTLIFSQAYNIFCINYEAFSTFLHKHQQTCVLNNNYLQRHNNRS